MLVQKTGVKINSKQVAFKNIDSKFPPITSMSVPQTYQQSQAEPSGKKSMLLPAAVIASAVVAVAGLAVGLRNSSGIKKLAQNIDKKFLNFGINAQSAEKFLELEQKVNELARGSKKNNIVIAGLLSALGGGSAVAMYSKAKNSADKTKIETAQIKNIKARIDNAVNKASTAAQNPDLNAYTTNMYGLKLLRRVDLKERDTNRYKAAITTISEVADKKITSLRTDNDLKRDSVVWSLTAEFDPIKAGGLAIVPRHVQNNFDKINVKMDTFMPMYMKDGECGLITKNNNGKEEYKYWYGQSKFDVEKVLSYKVNAYRNGRQFREDIDVFSHTQENGAKLYFIKNNNYFGNGKLYAATVTAGEEEKFAFYSKALYDLMKIKMEPKNNSDVKVHNEEKLNELSAPDGLFLNDWQVASVASIVNCVAPLEYAHKEISEVVKNKFANCRTLLVGHNAQYQGAVGLHRPRTAENILNTMFGDHTADIVKNAKIKTGEKEDSAVLLNGSNSRYVNMFYMGLINSDMFCPVSKNYANELALNKERSGDLHEVAEARLKNVTMQGVLNGNDVEVIDMRGGRFNGIISEAGGYIPYTRKNSDEEIISARFENKKKTFEKLKNVADRKETGEYTIIEDGKRTTKFPADLTEDKYADTPLLFCFGRAVYQKGYEISLGAIKKILDEWDTNPNHAGKPKPYIHVTAGDDDQKDYVEKIFVDFKKSLKDEDYDRVILTSGKVLGFPNSLSSSDFGLFPSWFEPCGLTQTEAMAVGTIPVTTRTGGFVDTVTDPEIPEAANNNQGKQTGYIADAHVCEGDRGNKEEFKKRLDKNVDAYAKAIDRALDDFYGKKEKIDKMSVDCIKTVDYSWLRPDGNGGITGPATDYMKLLGMPVDPQKDLELFNTAGARRAAAKEEAK